MDELAKKRKERDEAFDAFLRHSSEKNKHDLAARAARHEYVMAADEVRSMERDILSYPMASLI